MVSLGVTGVKGYLRAQETERYMEIGMNLRGR